MSPPNGYGPSPPGVRLPSLAGRAAVAGLLLGVLLALTVGLPAILLTQLGAHGVSSSITPLDTTLGGIAISVLSAAAYLLRPTRAYGPVVVGRAVATIVYFLLLVQYATVAIPVGSGATATVDYAALLQVLALLPLFGVVGGALVAVSDLRRLDDRLRAEFPAT